jgi:hypothetical protein
VVKPKLVLINMPEKVLRPPTTCQEDDQYPVNWRDGQRRCETYKSTWKKIRIIDQTNAASLYDAANYSLHDHQREQHPHKRIGKRLNDLMPLEGPVLDTLIVASDPFNEEDLVGVTVALGFRWRVWHEYPDQDTRNDGENRDADKHVLPSFESGSSDKVESVAKE